MTLEQYLIKSYCRRYNWTEDKFASISKAESKEHIRHELKYLERRLALLFGIKPDFLYPPNIPELEKRYSGERIEYDGPCRFPFMFYNNDWNYVMSNNKEMDPSIQEFEEEICKTLAIFWYIVVSHLRKKGKEKKYERKNY